MALNARRRNDHLVARTWSGQLSWLARMFFHWMCREEREITNCSAQVRGSCARSHFIQIEVFLSLYTLPLWHVAHLDHGLSHDPIPEDIQNQLNDQHPQDVDKIIFLLRPYPLWFVHADCAPQPVLDKFVSRKRDGGSSDTHLSSCHHHLAHFRHFSDNGTGIAGSSMAGYQCNFSCHCRGSILTLPLRTNCSRKAMLMY